VEEAVRRSAGVGRVGGRGRGKEGVGRGEGGIKNHFN